MNKLHDLDVPTFIVLLDWCFFCRIAVSGLELSDHVTAWLPVHDGVSQGTRVGPVVFLLMINDLLEHRPRSKYAA